MWPWISYVVKVDCEPLILQLPSPPICWDWRCTPPCPASAESNPGLLLCMLGRRSPKQAPYPAQTCCVWFLTHNIFHVKIHEQIGFSADVFSFPSSAGEIYTSHLITFCASCYFWAALTNRCVCVLSRKGTFWIHRAFVSLSRKDPTFTVWNNDDKTRKWLLKVEAIYNIW